MELQQIQLYKLRCSLCLDTLKDPATIPCGHSFCLGCIDKNWNENEEGEGYTCPSCAKAFKPRPALVVSGTFAALVEELARLQTAPTDDFECFATDEDIACDVCKGNRLKSVKSCLACRASYCEHHLQPHYESPAFLKHQLVPPSKSVAQSICQHHNEDLKMFCLTDQQVICFLCSIEEHKTHETVSAATERTKKLDQLGLLQEKVRQKVESKEKDIEMLNNEIAAIVDSANTVMSDSENVFGEVVQFIEKMSLQLKEHIRRQQEFEVERVKKIQEKLEEKIIELRQKDAELDEIGNVYNYSQFFNAFQTIPPFDDVITKTANTSSLKYFTTITVALSEMRDKLQDMLTEECDKILRKVPDVDVLLPAVEPNTREEFMQYSLQMTLDPSSVNGGLLLTDGNRKASVVREKQCYANHPDRFLDFSQVLSRHSVTGRSYWEVNIGKGGATVAVSYKSVQRTGDESAFGSNNKSWALNCFDKSFYFRHNKARMFISGPPCDKIGVYVNHREGILSFYAVGKNMTLLHRVETEFAEPLHAGLGLYWVGDSAQMC
ncbi:tripartite motif-containing protein 16-like [Boleophthalmus pectinirostris]|uniref:tripartite motif-containing protein 16-like n=1 Tax=Boleophthalmus pectinirostris TaxID=150288 RepID=UPI002430BA1D|nr:tripartite motif-containing protein 16-like [Boleophthalmus pectinirostris]